jgi:hypothetical protein
MPGKVQMKKKKILFIYKIIFISVRVFLQLFQGPSVGAPTLYSLHPAGGDPPANCGMAIHMMNSDF